MTGGTGFLGRRLLKVLLERGNEVVVLSRRPADGLRTIVTDITSCVIDLSGLKCSEVYHLAGLAHVVPRTAAERKRFFDVNVGGTKHLLEALERTGHLPAVVVMVSTVATYGVETGIMLDEDTPRCAVDPYGASKREAENLLFEWGVRHDVRTAVVRLPLVIGRDAPGNFGAMVQALATGRYMGVGSGAARRSMVLASDVPQGLTAAAAVGGAFHLTDGYHPTFAELERALAAALKRRPPRRLPMWLAKIGARMGDQAAARLGLRLPLTTSAVTKMTCTLTISDDKARRLLGWRSSKVLDHVREAVP